MRFIVHNYSFLDSTQAMARSHLREGTGSEGTVITAEIQTRGQGREGKAWVSLPGNLHATIILKPEIITGTLSLMMGVIIRRALHTLIPSPQIDLKWPNDILIQGKKVCGILIETEGQYALVGVGVNIERVDHIESSTFLHAYISPFLSTERVLAEILTQIQQQNQRTMDSIREEWLRHAYPQPGGIFRRGSLTGKFIGLSQEGFLLLEETPTRIHKIRTP